MPRYFLVVSFPVIRIVCGKPVVVRDGPTHPFYATEMADVADCMVNLFTVESADKHGGTGPKYGVISEEDLDKNMRECILREFDKVLASADGKPEAGMNDELQSELSRAAQEYLQAAVWAPDIEEMCIEHREDTRSVNAPPQTRLWDYYPLGDGAWGNISGFNDGNGDRHTIEMRMWLPPKHMADFSPPMYQPANVPLPPCMYVDGGIRRCYIPQPEDMELVRKLFPNATDASNPPWTRVEAELVAKGKNREELAKTTAPTLLLLWAKADLSDAGAAIASFQKTYEAGLQRVTDAIQNFSTKLPKAKKPVGEGMSWQTADPLIRKYLEKHAKDHDVTVRELADGIGCSKATVSKCPSYQTYKDERDVRKGGRTPRAVDLTAKVLNREDTATEDPDLADEIDESEELERLMAESNRDNELDPSPFAENVKRRKFTPRRKP